LLESQGDWLDAKDLQINLQGFLHEHSKTFVSELWALLLDASNRADGIPLKILQEQQIEKIVNDAKPIKEEKIIAARSRDTKKSKQCFDFISFQKCVFFCFCLFVCLFVCLFFGGLIDG
jgi:hypothetical protein